MCLGFVPRLDLRWDFQCSLSDHEKEYEFWKSSGPQGSDAQQENALVRIG